MKESKALGGYWWQCKSCGHQASFKQTTGDSSIGPFLWDKFVPSDWNQELLVRDCPECDERTLRIAYHHPTKKKKRHVFTYSIVGKTWKDAKYVPMMWETEFGDNQGVMYFDFKYIIGRKAKGLENPASLTRSELNDIFALYRARTGKQYP